MIVIAEDSVRFAHSGPSHNLLRPAIAELVSCGPLPLPVSGGGHASSITTVLPLESGYNKKRRRLNHLVAFFFLLIEAINA